MIYYSPSTLGFYIKGLHENIPKDSLVVSDKEYVDLQSALSTGKEVYLEGSVISIRENIIRENAEAAAEERLWRDSELSLADIELNKVQDSDSKASGSVSDWRNYRKDLRNWPQNANFPDKNFRPKSPRN